MDQIAISRELGVSDSTFSDWTTLAALEVLLRFLELLPEPARSSLVNSFLRSHCSLQSPRLSHDPAAMDTLAAPIQKPRGLTVICGPKADLRTFVFAALAGCASHISGKAPVLAGLDLNCADALVPVRQIEYLNSVAEPGEVEARAYKRWSSMRAQSLIFLNRIWPNSRRLRGEVLARSAKAHLVVAEDFPPDAASLTGELHPLPAICRLLSIHELGGDRITIELASLKGPTLCGSENETKRT